MKFYSEKIVQKTASFITLIIILFFANSYTKIAECCDQGRNGLSVSKDGHSLLKDGKPFFWMGDTGWHLFTRSPEDVDFYFHDRVASGFNTIQVMVTRRLFNEPDFTPNYRGDLPFENLNPVKLNEKYFAHIDTLVKKAKKYNLVLAMAPTWGPVLDQIFSVEDPGKAYDFGYLLGTRYKDFDNIIWIVCGEYHKVAWDKEQKKPDSNPDEHELKLLENLAQGLEAGHHGATLMTIHPDGWKSSSEHFHNAAWLDFNMVQTYNIGKGTEYLILNDYERLPNKPTILAEPGYEKGGAGNKSLELRYEGYHSVLDGAFGYTYGCEGVWNFKDNWKDLLSSEGNLQMKYMRVLFESRPLLNRLPVQEMIKGGSGDWSKKIKVAAAIADDGSYAYIYFPNDTIKAEIRVSKISGLNANAWWYNPRDGETYDTQGIKTKLSYAQLTCDLNQTYEFDPPGDEGFGKDWVLILDDSEKGYGKP